MNDSFWFKHDANARHDPKIMKIRRETGAVAKAVYWDLIEMLRSAGGRMLIREAIDEVVDENRLEDDSIPEYVIMSSGLFEREGGEFWSERLSEDIEYARGRAAKNRENGAKGGRPKKPTRNPEETQQKPNGFDSLTETKPKKTIDKRKEKEIQDNNLDSSLRSESRPTENQPDAEEAKIFPDSPVEKKAEVLSNKHCQQVVDFWNRKVAETGAQLPSVKSLSEDRKTKIRIRWSEFAKVGNPVEVCRVIFTKAAASKFLQGDNNNGWRATFDWLFTNGKNWVKVYEGNYDEVAQGGSGMKRTRLDAMKNELERIDAIFGGQDNGKQGQPDIGGFGVDEQ